MRKYQNYLLIFFCITFLISVLPAMKFPGDVRLFIVQSNSMEPAIKVKSLVVVKPQIIYQKNDVITFVNQNAVEKEYITTTHRLQMIINKNGGVYYMTKGDRNSLSDETFVPYSQVVGKVIKVVPHLGWIIDVVKSPIGRVFLVFFPALLIIRFEILNIQAELKKK